MKTPREILLERHRETEAQLDAVRRRVVEELHNKATKERSSVFVALLLRGFQNFYREVFWPARRVWAGLAAAWLLILLANLRLDAGAPRMTATNSRHSADFIMALREQEQVMAELTERSESKAVEPPKPFLPQPRSERRTEFFTI